MNFTRLKFASSIFTFRGNRIKKKEIIKVRSVTINLTLPSQTLAILLTREEDFRWLARRTRIPLGWINCKPTALALSRLSPTRTRFFSMRKPLITRVYTEVIHSSGEIGLIHGLRRVFTRSHLPAQSSITRDSKQFSKPIRLLAIQLLTARLNVTPRFQSFWAFKLCFIPLLLRLAFVFSSSLLRILSPITPYHRFSFR